VKALSLILRDHRDELRRRWLDDLGATVDADYRELLAGPLGERTLRTLVGDFVTLTQAEEYEVAGVLRQVDEQAATQAAHWLSLGFTMQDVTGGLHALRAAALDVLLDALVLDEMPSFGDSLTQLKTLNGYLDRIVSASITAS
jgi:hypothetical protein